MARPKRSAEEDVRQRIYQSAVDHFCQKGFAGARVEEIVTSAGVSVRMLYHYYGSKEGLYQQIVRDEVMRLVGSLPGDDSSLTPINSLRNLHRSYHQYVMDNPSFVRLLTWEFLCFPLGIPQTVLHSELPGTKIHPIITRGQADGTFSAALTPDIPLVTMQMNVVTMEILRRADFMGGIRSQPEATVEEQMWSLLLHGLAGPQPVNME